MAYAQIDGSRQKEEVFKDIESLLSQLQQDKVKIMKPRGMNIFPGDCQFLFFMTLCGGAFHIFKIDTVLNILPSAI